MSHTENVICCICLDDFHNKNKGQIYLKCKKNCQGKFHAVCFNKWYYETKYITVEGCKVRLCKKCPYCRTDFEIIDFIPPERCLCKRSTKVCNIL